jgi:hypothetical protein
MTANVSVGGVIRDVSGSSQRNQMFRVSLPVFALQHRVEWEADLTTRFSLAIPTLNHLAWMHSRTEKPHGGHASFRESQLSHEAVKTGPCQNAQCSVIKRCWSSGLCDSDHRPYMRLANRDE